MDSPDYFQSYDFHNESIGRISILESRLQVAYSDLEKARFRNKELEEEMLLCTDQILSLKNDLRVLGEELRKERMK